MPTTPTSKLPPLNAPPFTLESAIRKVRAAEDGWNSAIRTASSSPIRKIRSGGTGPSSPLAVTRFDSSWPASGSASSITA